MYFYFNNFSASHVKLKESPYKVMSTPLPGIFQVFQRKNLNLSNYTSAIIIIIIIINILLFFHIKLKLYNFYSTGCFRFWIHTLLSCLD